MAEIKKELKVFQVSMQCDTCDKGEMIPEGVTLLVSPPKYPHQCNFCGTKETYKVLYPTTRYEMA